MEIMNLNYVIFSPTYELHSIRETFGTTVPKLIMVKVWKHRRNVAAERL